MKKEKNIILEEGMRRFQQILEYTTVNGLMDEADDQPEDDTPDGGGDMPPMGGDPNGGGMDMNGVPQGGMDMGGGDPNAMGGGIPPMGGDSNGGMDMGGNGAAQTPEGFNPQDNMGGGSPDAMGDMPPMDGGENMMQPDDEVIDITDLTDKQDETEEEVVKINDKFDKVMKAIGQFEELVRTQNDNIDKLKTEFEKRNPTQLEKLSMQTSKSYPFSVTPNNYWDEKEATSNYRTEGDDNGKEQGQYVITKKDLDGTVDWKGISDTLNDDDFMYNQTLNRVLGRM